MCLRRALPELGTDKVSVDFHIGIDHAEASWPCGSQWTCQQIRGQGLTLALTDTELLNSPELYNHSDVQPASVKAWGFYREPRGGDGPYPNDGNGDRVHVTESRHLQDQGLSGTHPSGL